LTVHSEQYGDDTKSGIKGNSTDAADTTKTDEPAQQSTGFLVPVAQDTAGLFAHDEAFREEYGRATGSSMFDASQLANGAVDAGQVIVETSAETAARKRKRAIQIKPGEYKGFYEVCNPSSCRPADTYSCLSPTQTSPMSGKIFNQRKQTWKRHHYCLW
jgi:hypothetical protein